MKLTWDQVLRWRLHRHHLGATKARTRSRSPGGCPASTRRSPRPPSPRPTCGSRPRSTAEKIDKLLYDDRTLVRTWAARGTLHLLPAADLPTWVAAMSTRTRETTGSWLQYHGVTAAQMKDILGALPDVLGAEPLTREELADAIIDATGHNGLREPLTQGFGTVLKPAAFRGLLCSGPPRGRNVTFVAPRAWLPVKASWDVDTDEAVDTLSPGLPGRVRAGRRRTSSPAGSTCGRRWRRSRSPGSPPPERGRRRGRRRPRRSRRPTRIDAPAPAEDRRSGRGLLPAFDPYVVGSTRQLE